MADASANDSVPARARGFEIAEQHVADVHPRHLHPGELRLDQLELPDRASELHPGAGVLDGHVEALLDDPERHRGDARPLRGERRPGSPIGRRRSPSKTPVRRRRVSLRPRSGDPIPTRTSVRNSSPVGDEWRPILRNGGVCSKPGIPLSRMNDNTLRSRGGVTASSSLQMNTVVSANGPLVMNVFEPLRTNSSPSRTAVERIPPNASDPLSGSVIAHAPTLLSVSRSFAQRSR